MTDDGKGHVSVGHGLLQVSEFKRFLLRTGLLQTRFTAAGSLEVSAFFGSEPCWLRQQQRLLCVLLIIVVVVVVAVVVVVVVSNSRIAAVQWASCRVDIYIYI